MASSPEWWLVVLALVTPSAIIGLAVQAGVVLNRLRVVERAVGHLDEKLDLIIEKRARLR